MTRATATESAKPAAVDDLHALADALAAFADPPMDFYQRLHQRGLVYEVDRPSHGIAQVLGGGLLVRLRHITDAAPIRRLLLDLRKWEARAQHDTTSKDRRDEFYDLQDRAGVLAETLKALAAAMRPQDDAGPQAGSGGPGRKMQYDLDEARELRAEWEKSGLTREQFAAAKGVTLANFKRMLNRVRHHRDKAFKRRKG